MRFRFPFMFALVMILAACGPAAGPVREISITTRQFAYEPVEIRVRQGEQVRLLVQSADVTHGFAILEYNINQQAVPGQTLKVEFTADRPGRYTIFCTVFCGTGHSEHRGVLVVEGTQA